MAKEKFNLIHEKLMEKRRKTQKLEAPDDMVFEKLLSPKDEKDIKKTIEFLLKNNRDKSVGHSSIETAIDKLKGDKNTPKRTGKDKYDTLPYNLVAEVNDQEKTKAYDTKQKDNDSVVDSVVPGMSKPQSQLHNDSERFKGFSIEDVRNNKELRKMVTASLQDADAMLYYIYRQALNEKRSLSSDENTIISRINADKMQLIQKLFNNAV